MEEDLQSIHRIQEGLDEGLRQLMTRHKESLFGYVFRYVGNTTDAAEITEETFYRVFINAHKFHPKAKVKTWMFSIASNLCRDHLRRRKKHSLHMSLDDSGSSGSDASPYEKIASTQSNPAESTVSNEELQHIESAIHALPHRLKVPFIFCVLEDHSYDACADMLKTSRKTVETRIYRARKKLQAQLLRG